MEQQVKTISGLVSSWRTKASTVSTQSQKLLHRAINDFEAFGEEYESYFEDILANGAFDPTKTTAERLRYQYLQTLRGYWLSLEQVILQREVEYYSDVLEQAFEQSAIYLQNLNLPLPGTLIYFNKVSSIRYLPFTKIPILGIPYLFAEPRGWSAIAHEIGHYLYWNLGNNLVETPRRQEQLKSEAIQFLTDAGIDEKQQEFVIPWLEEIFSDVVGTCIDGSKFVEASEEFIKSQAGNEEESTFNDGHHPPLILRPFVWKRALRRGGRTVKRPEQDHRVSLNTMIKFPAPVLFGEEELESSLMAVQHEHDVKTSNAEALIPAIEHLVDFLKEKFDGLLAGIQPHETKITAFQELKGFMEEQRTTEKHKERQTYELLLTPRVLEGGVVHTHGYYIPFHGWHDATTHSH